MNIRGEGRKCVENIVIKPENIIVHSQYDSVRLQNDIALIKLRTNAPYTGKFVIFYLFYKLYAQKYIKHISQRGSSVSNF